MWTDRIDAEDYAKFLKLSFKLITESEPASGVCEWKRVVRPGGYHEELNRLEAEAAALAAFARAAEEHATAGAAKAAGAEGALSQPSSCAGAGSGKGKRRRAPAVHVCLQHHMNAAAKVPQAHARGKIARKQKQDKLHGCRRLQGSSRCSPSLLICRWRLT